MTPCPTCPGPDLCEPCPTCDRCSDCRCEPPVVTASDEHWRCEACGRGILDGERVHLYDDGVVAHIECPARASA